ncbi:hypothetical protein Tco_0281021 [Tanacetum coccineum]
MLRHVSLEERPIVVLGAIYRIEVYTEVCAGVIYANKAGAIYRIEVYTEIENSLYEKKFQEPLAKAKPTEDRYKGRGDKEVNMAAGEYDDALVCCVENTINDRIMDFGASFHATYCKEELERFKLRSGKVRLADDKTLDIAGIGDVVLKTLFGFGDQQWKVTKGSLVVAHGNKRRLGDMSRIGMSMLASKGNVLDVRKVDIYFCNPGGLGKKKNLSFIISVKTRKLQRAAYSRGGMVREGYYSCTLEAVQMKCDIAFGIRRVTRLSEAVDSIYRARAQVGDQIRVRGSKIVEALRIVEDQMKKTLKTEHSLRREASRLHRYKDPPENSWNEEPCRDVHQVGDEKEVKVLRSFNWHPRELITDDGVLPERGYSQFNDVSSGYLRVPYVWCYRKVRAVALLKGRWLEVYRDYLRRRAVK